MKGTLSKVVIFAAGAFVGSVVTWKLVKSKYEQIAQEEIDSVKEVFTKKAEDLEVKKLEDVDIDKLFNEKIAGHFETNLTKNKPNLMEYASKLANMNYADYADSVKKEDDDMCHPYVIEPEEFEELADVGYDSDNLTYYADGILADDLDNIIEDVENTVGFEALEKFGDIDDDSVFVRNDDLRCDYEIVRDLRRYSDVVGSIPHDAEDE